MISCIVTGIEYIISSAFGWSTRNGIFLLSLNLCLHQINIKSCRVQLTTSTSPHDTHFRVPPVSPASSEQDWVLPGVRRGVRTIWRFPPYSSPTAWTGCPSLFPSPRTSSGGIPTPSWPSLPPVRWRTTSSQDCQVGLYNFTTNINWRQSYPW